MPEARAFCASRAISSSTFLPTIIIMSASSSTMTTMNGSGSSNGTSFGLPSGPSMLDQQRIADRLPCVLRFLDLAIEAREVAHAERRHQLIATLHLGDAPAQRVGRLLHVGDDRRQQMRNALVHRQLQHLRIDHDQAHVLGGRLVEQRQHHRVDGRGLARAGRAADQQVRHAREIRDDRRAADVLAEHQRQRRSHLVVSLRLDDLAERHQLALLVRNLQADRRLAGNDFDHAHADRRQRTRQVLRQIADLADLDARRRAQLEARDDRAGMHFDDFGLDVEVAQLQLDQPRHRFERLGGIAALAWRRIVEQRQRRQLLRRRSARTARPGAPSRARSLFSTFCTTGSIFGGGRLATRAVPRG